MTDVGCEPAQMDQDAWLVDLLQSGPEFSVEDDNLTLRGSDGTILELVDRRIAEPDRPLVGTKWRLEGIIDSTASDGSMSNVPVSVRSTLEITEDGRIQLSPGCNAGEGSVEVDDRVLTLGPIPMTLIGCAGERGRVEEAVLTVLTWGEVDYSIDGDQLTLTNGDRGLVYRAD